MNIASTKCHVPKPSWGPTYDVSESLPAYAGHGASIADLGSAIDSYVARQEAGGAADGLHPYCAGVDSDTAVAASRRLKDESNHMQSLFDQKNPQQVLLSAQDVADVLDRHAARYERAGAEATELVEALTASRQKSLGFQLSSSVLLGATGVALALAAPAVPGWVPAVVVGGAALCGFDAAMNLSDRDLGSQELATARHNVGRFAREVQSSRDMGATAQAWAEHLEK